MARFAAFAPSASPAASCTTCTGVPARRSAACPGTATARPPGARVLACRTTGRGNSTAATNGAAPRARQLSARRATAARTREAAVRMASARSTRLEVALIGLFASNNRGRLAGIYAGCDKQ
ncbi:MAG TPA: hypothetical protein VF518_00475 [Polyangia bacterium]